MYSLKSIRSSALKVTVGLAVAASTSFATPPSTDVSTDAEPKARMGTSVVSTDQSNTEANLELTKVIRQRLIEDEKLSTAAQNLQVITTEDGMLHIKGNVASAEEKASVQKIIKDLKAVEGRTLDFQLVIED